MTFLDRIQRLPQVARAADTGGGLGGGPNGGSPPRSRRSQSLSNYWGKVRSYREAQPGLSTRQVRGSADFRRLYGRYRELREQLPEKHAGPSGPWKDFAEDYRELLEEMGVEDDADSRQIDWGS